MIASSIDLLDWYANSRISITGLAQVLILGRMALSKHSGNSLCSSHYIVLFKCSNLFLNPRHPNPRHVHLLVGPVCPNSFLHDVPCWHLSQTTVIKLLSPGCCPVPWWFSDSTLMCLEISGGDTAGSIMFSKSHLRTLSLLHLTFIYCAHFIFFG